LQDIDGHLRGGIPNRDIDDLGSYWKIFPTVRATFFKRADRPGYTQLKVAAGDIKSAIFGHAEFTAFNKTVTDLFAKWKQTDAPHLKSIAVGGHPKALIERLSEDLLEIFRDAPLLDPYDLYQHLMDYWAETMQDDGYMIVSDGWREATKPRLLIEEKDKKSKDKPDFTVGRVSPGGKVKSVHEAKAEFKIGFEDGSSTTFCLDNPGSSVAVRDKNNAVEYLG
jgi:type I restriction enzyme M protein